jgi:hypothetical protein
MSAIKIRDNETEEVFDYGTNRHHALRISENGSCLTFENLQNGDGSCGGGYSFVLDDGYTPEESLSPDAMNGATYANVGGFGNTVIEKILQEIEEEAMKNPEVGRKQCEGMERAINIIKKHLSDNDGCKKCSGCSRRKFYQLGYKDGKIEIETAKKEFLEDCKRTAEKYKKNNDGWTAIEDGLPEESLNSVIGWDAYRDRCCFVQYYNGRWILGNDTESVKIIAWRPLPEPYKPPVESADSKRMREREEFFEDGEQI